MFRFSRFEDSGFQDHLILILFLLIIFISLSIVYSILSFVAKVLSAIFFAVKIPIRGFCVFVSFNCKSCVWLLSKILKVCLFLYRLLSKILLWSFYLTCLLVKINVKALSLIWRFVRKVVSYVYFKTLSLCQKVSNPDEVGNNLEEIALKEPDDQIIEEPNQESK